MLEYALEGKQLLHFHPQKSSETDKSIFFHTVLPISTFFFFLHSVPVSSNEVKPKMLQEDEDIIQVLGRR